MYELSSEARNSATFATSSGRPRRRGSRAVHQILVMRFHRSNPENAYVDHSPNPYLIRIDGYLGPTALSAFPGMVSRLTGGDTLLTGLLDRSALYGVLAEIEALGLDLVELRRLTPK